MANYRLTRGQVEPLLDQLATLTVDNPAQQIRLGEFKAIAERRMRLLDTGMQQLAKLDQNEALQSFNKAQKMFRFREIANAIAEEEVGLLQARSASAARSFYNARVLTIAALITQLVLLGGMVCFERGRAGHHVFGVSACISGSRGKILSASVFRGRYCGASLVIMGCAGRHQICREKSRLLRVQLQC